MYTQNFYIALGVGALGLLIIALFIYLFLRGPKNKWKKEHKVGKARRSAKKAKK